MNSEVGDAIRAAAIEVVAREAVAVSEVSGQIDETFVDVAVLLMGCPGKVIMCGVGTSGFVARRAAHLFSVSGTPSFYLHPTEGLHGSMGVLQVGDVVVALSKGGSSSEVNDLATRVKRENVPVVALTSGPDTTLARIADIAVTIRPDDVADPGGVIAMGSTLAYGAWLDALAVVLMRAKGYGWDRVLFTHPGGAVGHIEDLPERLAPLALPVRGQAVQHWSDRERR